MLPLPQLRAPGAPDGAINFIDEEKYEHGCDDGDGQDLRATRTMLQTDGLDGEQPKGLRKGLPRRA